MTRVSYSYVPDAWRHEDFLRHGGFTVVFLNYNKSQFIEKSVESALRQDYPILEMFFMDDASTDGSGDIMERIVQQYHGCHKVTVVRNSENQGITGQWNIVSKLAAGEWFGMFCGDDIAHPDRVSIVAERVKKYPTLRGISTAAVDIDVDSGCPLPDSHYVPVSYSAMGTDSWASLDANFRSNGSTSFWHKSLFDDPLPKVPLDDNYLHFKLFVLNKGVDAPIFYYDSSAKTIDYSCGVGVCSGGVVVQKNASERCKWMQDIVRYKKFLSKWVVTMQLALTYAKEKGITSTNLIPFQCSLLWCKIRAGNTLSRLLIFPILCKELMFSHVPQSRKRQLVRAFLYYFSFEFVGLRIASFFRQFAKWMGSQCRLHY